ncbi:MAG: exonuclease domain-containing protein [Flavonifractor plautii]
MSIPGRILSRRSSSLTGITDEMLEGSPSQEEALRCLSGLCWGPARWRPTTPSSTWALSPRAASSMGIPSDSPPSTALILAQNLLPDLGKYKLDIVAEHLHLPAFNHHRASDDAATVGYMLPPFFKMLEDRGLHHLEQINPAMAKLRKGGKAQAASPST